VNAVRWVLRVAVAAGLTLALVGLSQVPWSPGAGGAAELRLAWRFRSTLVDECRRLSAAELANLPVHMRREMSCERRLTPYHLVVRLGGATVLQDTVRPGGARADRPLSFYRDLRVAPGALALSIRFAPLLPESAGVAARPPTLTLDTALVARPHRVVLVTLDEARGVLVVR